jgi:hypothetical protein
VSVATVIVKGLAELRRIRFAGSLPAGLQGKDMSVSGTPVDDATTAAAEEGGAWRTDGRLLADSRRTGGDALIARSMASERVAAVR